MNQHSPPGGSEEPAETGKSALSGEAGGSEGSDGAELSGGSDVQTAPWLSTVFSAIADEHRRAVLRAASRAEAGELPLDELVVAVDEAVHSVDEDAFDEQRRRRVRTTLHHNHLPKLDASGLIEYDSGAGVVRVVRGEVRPDIFEVIGIEDGRD